MGSVVEFDIRVPLSDKTVRKHIAHARTLGLREAFEGEPDALTIIANGPSAWNAPHDGYTCALNGALKVIPNPTFWAGCDPQKHLSDFVKDAPSDTIYYAASKCHADVFKALRGKDVRLWDIGDFVSGGVPSAVSITITALSLFARLGWRKFNIYGWDASFGPNLEHHGGDEPFTDNPDIRYVEVGDKTFTTTATWAAEAQDAAYVIPLLEFLGCEINIFGPSMVEAIRQYTKKAA